MKNRIQSILKTFFRSKTKTLMTILSMAVVFSMVYSLILPAIAVEKTAALEEPGMEIGAASSSGGEASEQSQELNPEPASEQITEQLSEQLSEPAEDAPADSGNDQEASFSAGLNDGKGTEPDTAAQTEPAADRSGSVSDAVFDHESGGKANNLISEPDTNASDINASGASSSDSIYSGEAGEQSAFGGSGALSGSNAGEDIQNTGSLRADFVTGNTSAESEEFSDCDEQNQDIAMPAMTFEDVYKYLDADEEERQIRVFVKAEEGTFPEGTRMVLGDVEDQSALEDAIEKTVKEELSDTARIRQYQAVDISFYNADGIQIEPAKEVEVRMTSDQIKQISNPMLLHIPDRKDDEKDPVADIIRQFKRIDEQEDELVGNENTLKFNASVFSPYIIAEVEGYEDADGNQFEDRYQDASEDLNYDVSDDPDYDNSGDSDYEASEDPDYDTSGDSQIDDLEIVIEDENDNDQPLQFRGVDYTVTLEYNEDAGIPAGAELSVTEISSASRTYQSYIRKTAHALEDTDAADICYARFFDISILSEGEKVQPEAPVTVTIDFDEEIAAGESSTFNAVHFTEDNQTEIITENADVITSDESADVEAVTFEAESFSVYGITYTVDFHWEVDGKTYDFSLPGGGFVSFSQLVEVLKIIGDTNSDTNAVLTLGDVEVSDAARKFVADVESVVFSNPALLDVSRVNADTTVGQIKESRGLECRYSTELTEEQIEASNGTEVESGDWALISLLPFSSEEELTVTMKDGEAFTIHVTDYQICTNVLTADGKNYKITVTYEDDAKIPDGTKLVAEEISFSSDEYLQHLGQAWSEVNREYLEQEQQLRSNIGGLDDGNEGEEIHPVNLDHVRFFDIRLERNGEEVEPEVPVKVEIQYVDGFPVPETENPEAGVVHFHNDDTELIEEIETEEDEDGNLTCFRYMQDGFSDVGTYLGQETIDDDTASVAGRIAYPKLSAMLRASSGPLKDELGEPAASKTLKDNEDGTYTLSLSVTGAAKKKDEQPKANVLFVMDRSSSMSNSDNDIYLPYDGEHKNGTIYYGTNDNGKSYFALNYSNGRYTYNDYMYPYTTHTYSGTVYTRISRLKAEQDAMSILFKDLLENNKDQNGSYTKDNVEISVISFADDRGKMSEGTEYPKNGSANGWTSSDYTGLMEVVNNTNTPSGTNWQDALKYAKEVADAKKVSQPDEPVFVIFLTDGEPTAIYGESGGAYHYNNVGGGFVKAYTPARPDAKAIVDEGYGFYSIFTFNPGEEQTRYLKRLVHYAYTGYDVSDTTTGDFSYLDSSQYVSRYFYNADSPENLASAFDDILSAITTTIAHGNVSIVDGLTTDAMTSTLINGKANGFTYKVTDENSNVLYTVTATGDTDNPSVTFKINGTTYSGSQVVQKEAAGGKKYCSMTVGGKEYRMALADFVDTGEGDEETKELTWDLSPIGTLADKCTYSIEFVVWPNQEAYDYVAALNNGLKDWNKATQTPVYDKDEKLIYYKNGVEDYPSIVLDPDTGIYSVLTNTKQELEYSIVSTTNGVETIEGPYTVDLDTPDPMELKATASALEKIWNIARDPDILAQLLYGDLNNHYSIGFDILRDESKTKYISIGLGWDEKQGKYIWETDDLIYVK
ncbi:MAG: hypothetical protein IJ860_06600, partial [Eubacterium sp.]|nr:hypothetical protein [Eubacterium sp.]